MPAPDGGMQPFDPSVASGFSTNLLAGAAAPVSQEPLIFAGWTKSDQTRYMPQTGQEVKVGGVKTPTFLTASQFMSRFDNGSRDDFLRLRNLLVAAGIVSPEADPYTVRNAFGSVLDTVADINASGTNMSPLGYVKNLIRMNGMDPSKVGSEEDAGDALSAAMGEEPFTGTKRTVSRSVTDITEGQAWSALRGTLSQMLGRDPKDEELREFTYRMNSLAAQNPSISTTITRYKDGEAVGARTNTEQGFTADDMAMEAYESAQNEPDYAEYQAATTYYNALLGALGPIGGGAVG